MEVEWYQWPPRRHWLLWQLPDITTSVDRVVKWVSLEARSFNRVKLTLGIQSAHRNLRMLSWNLSEVMKDTPPAHQLRIWRLMPRVRKDEYVRCKNPKPSLARLYPLCTFWGMTIVVTSNMVIITWGFIVGSENRTWRLLATEVQ